MDYKTYNLVVVDIQPEYQKFFGFSVYNFIKWVNNTQFKSIHWFFNGPDLGYGSEMELQNWLTDVCGLEQDKLYDINFYDKGYAFFRSCIDRHISDKEIIHLIRFMLAKGVDDSRDMDKDFWDDFEKQYNYFQSSIRRLLDKADDLVNIPELLGYIKNRISGNSLLVGGAKTECLKEVELCFRILGKTYKKEPKWIY
jgi:hypothetical protein